MGDMSEWHRLYDTFQRRRGFTSQTIRQRRTVLNSFARWMAPADGLDATVDDIEAWLDHRPLENHTRYSYISTLSVFFAFVHDGGGIIDNPAAHVIRPRRRRLMPRPAGAEQLAFALASADDRLRAMLALAAFQGLRVKEIAGLEASDVLFHHTPPMLLVRDGKGGHQRTLPLSLRAELALRRYGVPPAGPLFFNLRTGNRLTPAGVSRIISDHFHRLGHNVTAHQCRHLFATLTYQRSLDLRMVQELMGHADPATTAIYAAYADERAVAVVRDLSL